MASASMHCYSKTVSSRVHATKQPCVLLVYLRDDNADDLEAEKSDEGEAADEDGFVVLDCEEDEEDAAFYKQKGDVAKGTINLADLVMQQLKKQTEGEPAEEKPESSLSPKVVEVYTAMAPFMARYRSGKIPKAFKIIPRLHAWEEVLVLTNPPMWSKQATREATRIFCSNLREPMAQRFLCTVLLPAVRDDIAENKKLNYHLYMALKKALFKPGAFFKGIYLPLALDVRLRDSLGMSPAFNYLSPRCC